MSCSTAMELWLLPRKRIGWTSSSLLSRLSCSRRSRRMAKRPARCFLCCRPSPAAPPSSRGWWSPVFAVANSAAFDLRWSARSYSFDWWRRRGSSPGSSTWLVGTRWRIPCTEPSFAAPGWEARRSSSKLGLADGWPATMALRIEAAAGRLGASGLVNPRSLMTSKSCWRGSCNHSDPSPALPMEPHCNTSCARSNISRCPRSWSLPECLHTSWTAFVPHLICKESIGSTEFE